jgi:hypothetical protein
MVLLSQALPLGYLSSPHSAFQEHATHTTRWPVVLSSKGSQGTCIPCGVATFLLAAFTAHSCESPWYLLAKHHLLEACFLLMVPFRARFSPCRMACTAHAQRLIGCLYTLRYFYIPAYRFMAQQSLRTHQKIYSHSEGVQGGQSKKHEDPVWGAYRVPYRTSQNMCPALRETLLHRGR